MGKIILDNKTQESTSTMKKNDLSKDSYDDSSPTWMVHWKTHQFAVQEIVLGFSKWSWNLVWKMTYHPFLCVQGKYPRAVTTVGAFGGIYSTKCWLLPQLTGRCHQPEPKFSLSLAASTSSFKKAWIVPFNGKLTACIKVVPLVVVFTSGTFMISRLKQCYELVGRKRLVLCWLWV